ncbi:hypothetical protein CDV31_007242 [Fusarium ambrosium]|uniref:F-box domain-containing protein n=1 Tax=Fusarium ambrosium TaxID=131363 RepID=A0A428U804_9HYPO|nr:hypothetical protein CDV31_007242 [Fusarium ambrosium]
MSLDTSSVDVIIEIITYLSPHDLAQLTRTYGAFPSLRHVYLYGFAVGKDFALRPSKKTPGGRFMRRLKKRDVSCEARLGRWTEFEGVNNETSWAEWGGEGREYRDKDQPDMKWDTLMARV